METPVRGLERFTQYGEKPLEDFARSLDLQREAETHIPEIASSNHRGASKYAPYPLVYMEDADGSTLTDVDGNDYLDFHCGVSAIILGHNPPAQREAVTEQVTKGPYFATTHETEVRAAELMNELVPYSDRTKFTSTGTEAVMSAVKLARAYTGKDKLLTFEGMYHGHSDYALVNVHPPVESLGTTRNPNKIPESTGIPGATLSTVESIPWNDAALLEETLERKGDEIAAVITEAVMSNSGLLWPQPDYLSTIERLADEYDVVFILDEVVTGFRMGLGGAQAYFDIEPDLAVYGKAMANGYPAAALTGKAAIMGFIQGRSDRATFMGTFSGNPLVLAATEANLRELKSLGDRGYDELFRRGERLVDGLRDLLDDSPHEGFVPDFAGFTFLHFTDGDDDPSGWRDWRDIGGRTDMAKYETFAAEMIGQGVFIPPKGDRINLTHAHTDEHVERALEAAKLAISKVE